MLPKCRTRKATRLDPDGVMRWEPVPYAGPHTTHLPELLNGEVVGVVRHPALDDQVYRAGVPDVGEGVVA